MLNVVWKKFERIKIRLKFDVFYKYLMLCIIKENVLFKEIMNFVDMSLKIEW